MIVTEVDVPQKLLLPELTTADDVPSKILLPVLVIAVDVPPKRLPPVLVVTEDVLEKGALTRLTKLVSFLISVNPTPVVADIDEVEVDEEPNLKADPDSKEGAEADAEILLILVAFELAAIIAGVIPLLL